MRLVREESLRTHMSQWHVTTGCKFLAQGCRGPVFTCCACSGLLLLLGWVRHFEFLSPWIRPRNLCLSADGGLTRAWVRGWIPCKSWQGLGGLSTTRVVSAQDPAEGASPGSLCSCLGCSFQPRAISWHAVATWTF